MSDDLTNVHQGELPTNKPARTYRTSDTPNLIPVSTIMPDMMMASQAAIVATDLGRPVTQDEVIKAVRAGRLPCYTREDDGKNLGARKRRWFKRKDVRVWAREGAPVDPFPPPPPLFPVVDEPPPSPRPLIPPALAAFLDEHFTSQTAAQTATRAAVNEVSAKLDMLIEMFK